MCVTLPPRRGRRLRRPGSPPHPNSPPLSNAQPRTPRHRLWLAAAAALCLVLTLAASEAFTRLRIPDPRLFLGYDLLPSYVAGQLVREGRGAQLYDSPAFQQAESRVIREANLKADARFAPWLNPPFYAGAFAPLSRLPYRPAARVALATTLLLAAASALLLIRMLPPGGGWRTCGLVPACLLASAPFWEILCSLQNTFLSLLLLCGTVTFWRRGQGLRAGLVAGLLLFKPQLAAVVGVVLVASLGRRAATGFLATAAALLLTSVCSLPGSLGAFLTGVPPIVRHLQEQCPYNWGRQATFQSFWRLALQGHAIGPTHPAAKLLWAASSGAVLVALGMAVWRSRRSDDGTTESSLRRDRLIAAAIVSMPLLMPYYMEYDLLLLAVPAVLLAAEQCRPTTAAPDRWLVRAWVAHFVGVAVNPLVAGTTRLNLAVPLLFVVAALSLARCLRKGPAAVNMPPAMETGSAGHVGRDPLPRAA